MKDITKKEMETVLMIVKSPEVAYNANNLAKVLGITSMGTLKILKRLEKDAILKARQIGKAFVYHVNLASDYAKQFVSFVLQRESLHAKASVRRWVNEINKVENADIAVLFGSMLSKKDPNDVDVLFVTDQKRFKKLQNEIKELNQLNVKKIHPMYQSYQDIVKNIKKRDKPLLNAIKGIVVFGENKFLEIYDESRKE